MPVNHALKNGLKSWVTCLREYFRYCICPGIVSHWLKPVILMLGFTLKVQLGFRLRQSNPRNGAFNHQEVQRHKKLSHKNCHHWRLTSELGSLLLRRDTSSSYDLEKKKNSFILFIIETAVLIDVGGHKLISYSYSNARNYHQIFILCFSLRLFFSLVKLKWNTYCTGLWGLN